MIAAFSARANTCSPWTAVFPVFRPAWRPATSFPHFFTKITIHDATIGFSCSFRCFSMIVWLNYHVTFCRNDITSGVTLSQNGRKYPVNTYQLWTMSFCTARRASLRTLGSLWDIIFITLTLQPRFSSTLRIKEHTHSDWKHKSFVENSLDRKKLNNIEQENNILFSSRVMPHIFTSIMSRYCQNGWISGRLQ